MSMTTLKRLLQRVDYVNNPKNGTVDDYRNAIRELGDWTYLLWRRGRLDPNITVKPKKGERT